MDEMSYLDLLNKLHKDIEYDICMQWEDRERALNMISRLEEILWQYSA